MIVRKIAKLLVLAFALPILALPAAFSPSPVSAAGCWEGQGDISLCFGGDNSGIPKPKGAITIGDGVIENGVKGKIIAVANRVIELVALVAIGGIVIGGFHMVTAFGEDEKHKKGKEAVKWSLLGFVLALVSFPLVNAIVNLFYTTGG